METTEKHHEESTNCLSKRKKFPALSLGVQTHRHPCSHELSSCTHRPRKPGWPGRLSRFLLPFNSTLDPEHALTLLACGEGLCLCVFIWFQSPHIHLSAPRQEKQQSNSRLQSAGSSQSPAPSRAIPSAALGEMVAIIPALQGRKLRHREVPVVQGWGLGLWAPCVSPPRVTRLPLSKVQKPRSSDLNLIASVPCF